MKIKAINLLVLFGTETCVAVGELDVELGRTCDDDLSVLGRDRCCDFSCVDGVVHQEDFQLTDVVYDKLLKAGWEHVSCLFVGTETNRDHVSVSLESTTVYAINTLWTPP